METLKGEQVHPFDISKICRACLTEKDEMRSVFAGGDDTLAQGMRLAEILMEFSQIQVSYLLKQSFNTQKTLETHVLVIIKHYLHNFFYCQPFKQRKITNFCKILD